MLPASMQFQKVCAMPELPGFSLIRKAAANDGSLLFLLAETSATRPRLRLVRMTAETSEAIDIPSPGLRFPHVDIFPDGRILVVAARCGWRSEHDFDLNGAVIQPETGGVDEICLGDGISHVQIDDLGRIWVGYFDEGVFGNHAWGGCTGLNCFSASGAKIWEFPPNATHEISDCYALNVSGSDAAIFFYTDFPLCKISSNFELTFWKTDLAGCHALAISETEVLFSGQYRDPPDAAYLGRLSPDAALKTSPVRLLMPDGSSRPKGQLRGRGKSLYYFDDKNVYHLSLD